MQGLLILEACLADVMLKDVDHQGRCAGKADSKQHKTEPSDLQRLHLDAVGSELHLAVPSLAATSRSTLNLHS